jgi:uncharacterized protein
MIQSTDIKPSQFWRIIHFPLVRLVIGIICVITPLFFIQFGMEKVSIEKGSSLIRLGNLVACAMSVLGYIGFVRFIERRRVTELNLVGAGREWASGIAIGLIMFGLTIGAIALAGSYKIIGVNPVISIVPVALNSIIAGITEEILLRGLFFRIVEEWVGSWIALAASAVLFGALHLLNPNATPIAAVAIALEAGLMLGVAYMLTRRLWLAIGIHMAWNFAQGGIFGVAVSGSKSVGLLQSVLSGPEFISGGAFGAEASIFAVVFGVALTLIFLRIAIRRNNIVHPFWRESNAEHGSKESNL